MFKKLIGRTRVSGRAVQKFKPRNLFSESDWKKWLLCVKNFYRSTTTNHKVSPLFCPKVSDNRPYILVEILGVEICGLLDFGSTSTVIGAAGIPVIENLNLNIREPTHLSISTADNTEKKIVGVVDLPLVVDGSCQVISAIVVPSLPHSFIFGCDFILRFDLMEDLKKNWWEVNSRSQPKFSSFPYNTHAVNMLCTLDDLTPNQRKPAELLINSFDSINSDHGLGRTDKITMSIDTGDAKPFRQKPFLMSPYMSKILNEELNDMLKLGVVEPSNSPWCSPVLLVKKPTGEFRFCFDGRSLNQVTKYDSYPMPNIDRILNSLRGATYISSIDLRKSFWQIPLSEDSKPKTAFSIVGRGQFQFTTVPFGLCNAAQTQQRLVDAIFGPRYEPHIFCYLDDIIICSPSFEEHTKLLSEVRDKLKDANLTINIKKCEFFKKSLKFLGYIVGSNSLRTDPEKISAMLNFPRPTTTTEIKRFIGLCSWYRRFIRNFSTLVSPINDLLKGKKKGQGIQWSPAAEDSFLKIKQLLVSAPILSQPDFSKPFIIETDASNTGLGGVLLQKINDEDRVISYASRSLTRSERNYSVTERECLAVIFSLEKFRPWIDGVRFTVCTDHYSLLWLNKLQNPTGRLARWAVRLRQFTFDLVHRKGSHNVVPDFLSRIPGDDSPSDISDNDSFVCPQISILNIDLDHTDAWYETMKRKILASPSSFPQWKVEDGFLFKFIPVQLPFSSNLQEWKKVVPRPQRRNIIESCHNPPTCSHLGFYKTLSRLQEQFYWPKMRADVLKFVRSCRVCGAQKSSNTMPLGRMGREKQVNMPFQTIALDLMGPFPRSKKGHKWLLVVGDWFSKYVLLCPLRSSKSPYVVKYLESEVFLTYGVPQYIICDNGPQFVAKEFRDLAKKYQVQKIWYNAVYSPQCNFVERMNKTIGTAIRTYVKQHTDWDVQLSNIQFALNTSKHEVTGFSPSFLVFGRHIPISGNYYGQVKFSEDFEIMPGDRNSYASELKNLYSVFSEVRKKLHAAYERNSKSYNLRRRDLSFQVGDLVWRRNKVLSNAGINFSAKLAPRFILSSVRKKISNLVYVLVDENGTNAGRWHIKDLKPYQGHMIDDDDTENVSTTSQ